MKILYITPEYPYLEPSGGIGSYVQDIATEMASLGNDVKILCVTELPAEVPPVYVINDDNIEIHFVSKRVARWFSRLTRVPIITNILRVFLPNVSPLVPPLAAVLHWRNLKKKWVPDIIEVFDWQATGFLLAYCRGNIPFVFRGGGHCKAVLTRNNIPWTSYHEAQHRLERWCARRSSLLVPCSDLLGRDEISDFQIPQEKIIAVPFCVSNHALIQKTIDNKIKAQKLKAIFVGRMEFRKGIDLLIRAAQSLFPRYSFVEYYFLGRVDTNPMFFITNDYMKDAFQKSIHVVGPLHRNQVYEFISSCDFAIFPSRYEPFGIVALEAMACGLPVIVSDAGGWREAVEDGVSGFICKAGDWSDLRDRMEKMITMTHEERKAMGERGRQMVIQNYTPGAIGERMLEIYRSLLNGFSKGMVG